MDAEGQRAALRRAMVAAGTTPAALSRLIGRNPAYLQQYLLRGTPRLLAEADRAILARFLGLAEAALGGPAGAELVPVRRLDVGASAGPGRLPGAEPGRAPARFPPELLRQLGVRGESASVIRVEGDSMAPGLADGDEILVDGDQRSVAASGGVFVIRLDEVVMVKRLRPAVGGLAVISDNPAYPTVVRRREEVAVIGRVAWLGRALR
jgi:repressor LexA